LSEGLSYNFFFKTRLNPTFPHESLTVGTPPSSFLKLFPSFHFPASSGKVGVQALPDHEDVQFLPFSRSGALSTTGSRPTYCRRADYPLLRSVRPLSPLRVPDRFSFLWATNKRPTFHGQDAVQVQDHLFFMLMNKLPILPWEAMDPLIFFLEAFSGVSKRHPSDTKSALFSQPTLPSLSNFLSLTYKFEHAPYVRKWKYIPPFGLMLEKVLPL